MSTFMDKSIDSDAVISDVTYHACLHVE